MTYTPEEQAEHRATLAAALLSGKYQQTTGVLRRKDAFCCLGVACEISGLGTWEEELVSMHTYSVGGIVHSGSLPLQVQQYYGFVGSTGLLRINPRRIDSLSEMNDSGGSFADIALVILDNGVILEETP